MTINAMVGKNFKFRKDYIDEEGNCIIPAGSVLKMLRVSAADDNTIMCYFRIPNNSSADDIEVPEFTEEAIPVKFAFVVSNCVPSNTVKMVQLNIHEKEDQEYYEGESNNLKVKEEHKMQDSVDREEVEKCMESNKEFMYKSREQIELFKACSKRMDINDYKAPDDEYPRILEDLVTNYNNMLAMIDEMQERVGYMYKVLRVTKQLLKEV
jgi:hypothetical protein